MSDVPDLDAEDLRRGVAPGIGVWGHLLATLCVVLGGAVGTALRAVLEASAGSVPAATFGINVAGSFLLGALLEVLARGGSDVGRRRLLRLGCGTGVLGGFTTYSTFVLEVDRLLDGGAIAVGIGYALASVVLGVLAALLGIGAARVTSARRSRPEPSA